MRTKHNKTFAALYGGIAAIAVMLLLTLCGCSTEKRAVRQAVKIQAQYPHVMASACGSYYPPLDSVHEKIVYKQGETVTKNEISYVTVDCDSALEAVGSHKGGKPNVYEHGLTSPTKKTLVRVPCPPCDSFRVDTVDRARFEQNTNKGKEVGQAKTISDQEKTIACLKTKNKIMLWALVILGVYTLGRWVLRRWNIKLP